jgi:hypothetical protein
MLVDFVSPPPSFNIGEIIEHCNFVSPNSEPMHALVSSSFGNCTAMNSSKNWHESVFPHKIFIKLIFVQETNSVSAPKLLSRPPG